MNSIPGRIFRRLATAAVALLVLSTLPAAAETLMERVKEGKTIRIGYANTPPWAYPGEQNEPLGFVNAIVMGTLKKMNIGKVESVVTDWGGLVPGLIADRYDIITGGIYIIKSRCDNVAFSDPIGTFGDVFMVHPGNPKKIETYDDIKANNSTMVTVTGYNIVEVAKKLGVPDDKVMQVPGPSEMFAAFRAGRADAIATNYFEARTLMEQSPAEVEITDTTKMPDWTKNWSGIAFRKEDTDFVKAYDKAQADYLGSDAMMTSVAQYGYTKAQLPNQSTAFACANR